MEQLRSSKSLVVSQKKEWGEILTGFETRNKYVVSDTSGRTLYFAAEEKGSLLALWFLRALRPFTIVLLSKEGREVMRIKRKFRFYFHRAEIFDAQGTLLGAIERRFSILRRKYTVYGSSGNEIYQLFGPLLHPWTFRIKKDGSEYGMITKKWSGLLKESFTDADTFGVTFPVEWDIKLKALFMGAVFLIDFVHFENKGNN